MCARCKDEKFYMVKSYPSARFDENGRYDMTKGEETLSLVPCTTCNRPPHRTEVSHVAAKSE